MLKRIFFIALSLFVLQCQAATETYTLDPKHTYVMWHANHFGFSNPSGKWFASGTLRLDEASPQNSQLNVTIAIDELNTGLKDLDEHLKAALFLDAAKYPVATFQSEKITLTGKKTAKVQGVLTLHGVSKPVTLTVTLNKIGMSEITNRKTVGFSATATLKRSDFGIMTLLPGVGDDVTLDIQAEGYVS